MKFRGLLLSGVLLLSALSSVTRAEELPTSIHSDEIRSQITPLSDLESEAKPDITLEAAEDKLSPSEFESRLLTPKAESLPPITASESLEPLTPATKAVPPDNEATKIEPAAPEEMSPPETEALNDAPAFKAVKTKPQIYYTPLSAVAVFPVMKFGMEHAFYDVPQLFARELSVQLEGKMPQTHVWNPGYIQQAMKSKGLEHLYQDLLTEYKTLGRPNPVALQYLLKQLTPDDQVIARVVFVEADLDTSDPMSFKGFSGIRDKVISMANDQRPSHPKYYVRSRIQIYDTLEPDAPRVWLFNWRRSVRTERFNNITPSVFGDTDSEQALGEASRFLGRAMLGTLPKKIYMEQHVDTSVQAEVVQNPNAGLGENLQQSIQNGLEKLNNGFHNVNLNPLELINRY